MNYMKIAFASVGIGAVVLFTASFGVTVLWIVAAWLQIKSIFVINDLATCILGLLIGITLLSPFVITVHKMTEKGRDGLRDNSVTHWPDGETKRP